MNGMHIRLLPDSYFAEELKKLYPNEKDESKFLKTAALLKPRLKFTTELPAMSNYFFERPEKIIDEKSKAKYWTEQSPKHIDLISKELEKISDENFNIKNIETAFMNVCESSGVKLGMLAQPARLAISGVGAGPGLWEIIECIGREECIFRLHRVN